MTDTAGKTWDVTVGRESWGSVQLLFVPRGGGDVRVTDLAAEEVLAGEQELVRLSDDELRHRLARARPWRG